MKPKYRNIQNSPGNSFAIRLFEDKEFSASWHFHSEYELTYVLESTGMRYIGDHIGNFKKGDLVLVGANLPHCWKTINEQPNKVQCITIQWEHELLESWLSRDEFIHIRELVRFSSRGIHFSEVVTNSVHQLLTEMLDQQPFDRFLSLLEVLQYLAKDAPYTFLASHDFLNDASEEESERINLVYNYVREHYARQIRLEEVAQIVSLSKEAFCRFFKKTTNKPFFVFLNEYKINLATKLLIDTDHSISQIAYSIGYNNLTFFYRQFQKFKNTSPSEFRKLYRNI